jgi:hypothetical protein
MKKHLFVIIPVAAIVLVIGLFNIIPAFLNNDIIDDASLGISATTENPEEHSEISGELELFLPFVIEKTFFEDRILAAITDSEDLYLIEVYFNLRESDRINFPEYAINGMLRTYTLAHNSTSEFYMPDANASESEKNILLDIFREHTDLTGNDIMQMYRDSGVIITETPDPYAHVRFGATRDILLLDIKWHSVVLEWEEVSEAQINKNKKGFEEYMRSDQYMALSDGQKERFAINLEEIMKRDYEKENNFLNIITDIEYVYAKYINGIHFTQNIERIDLSMDAAHAQNLTDPDGYFLFRIYPSALFLVYIDENGENQYKHFAGDVFDGLIYSKQVFDRVVSEQVRPYIDDIIARGGWIAQEEYIKATTDPLEWYANMWF